MLAVEQPQEGAVGDGRRHVAELRQAVQAQLPHARHIVIVHRRPDDDVGEQRQGAVREPGEDGEAGDDAVRPDVGVELRAEPRERLVHLDRRSIAAALVEHVGGDRGQAVFPGGVGRGAAADQQRERHERHLRVARGPHAQPVGQRRFLDGGKRERARRAGDGQLRAIDLRGPSGAHETTVVVESGAASPVRPCGTMLSVTRRAGSR